MSFTRVFDTFGEKQSYFWPEGLIKICSKVLEEKEVMSCKNGCFPLYSRVWLVGGSKNFGIVLEVKCF